MKHVYWVWKNYLSMKNIENINKIALKNINASWNDDPARSRKTSKVNFIEYLKIKSELNNCINDIYTSNKNNFNSIVYPFDETTKVFYNTYEKGTEYDWHIDGNSQNNDWDYKFTVLINISDKKYKGGKFKMWHNGTPQEIKEFSEPGDMLMFRSFFLHKVTPITSGTRKTLTILIKGSCI